MLKLCDIKKSYVTGDFIQHALNGVSVEFTKNEFVSVLGPSGSGKTTLLNIVGGLDRYDSGDLIINGKSTKQFSQTEWDSYRNNCIGFVFQSYNLISHLTVLENVELGMTLSGISAAKRRKRALLALEKMGIKEHAKKKPNQLSGGQMQRVAIARAISGDPDIILADEPTGALDSVTSEQIMDILKELSKEKLVIMVTHNGELAQKYSDRILEFKDGSLVKDSGSKVDDGVKKSFTLKKTSMSFFTALRLSLKNIFTKKLKTTITAVAASIGIIGISLILALSNGFGIQIDSFQARALGSFPIIIQQSAVSVDPEDMMDIMESNLQKFPDVSVVYPFDKSFSSIVHTNIFTDEFMDYVKSADRNVVRGLSYTRGTSVNLLYKTGDTIKRITGSDITITLLPLEFGNTNAFLNDDYDVLATLGDSLSESVTDVFLVVDSRNRLDEKTIELLGLDPDSEGIPFDEFLGLEFKFVPNDVWYSENNGYFTVNSDLSASYNNEQSVTLRVAGVVRTKEASELTAATDGLLMRSEMMEEIVKINSQSEIVTSQKNADYDVRTGLPFPDDESGSQLKSYYLAQLGDDTLPYAIFIYPADFDAKDLLIEYLDAFNEGKEEADRIVYTDMATTISNLSSNILNAITIVLVVFSSISLVVSSIMIGIITYSSVIERTREIGILRALGARKSDICRVFNAETFIIGIFSGIIGIVLSALSLIPANMILKALTELDNVAVMNPIHTVVLVLICIATSVIGGLIPAIMASLKDPVTALRTD